MFAIGQCGADEEVAVVQVDGDDARRARPRELGKRRLFHRPVGSGHEYEAVIDKLLDRQHRGDLFVLEQGDQVDDRLAARDAAALRHVVDLEPVDAPAIREAQNVIVRVGDEQVVDEIVFLGARRLLASPATPLRAVLGNGLRLHVATMRERDHHVFGRDEILQRQIDALGDDFGAALIAELIADRLELIANNDGYALRLGKNVEQVDDLLHHVFVFGGDLVLFQPSEPLQAQLENGLRLRVGKLVPRWLRLGLPTELRRETLRAGGVSGSTLQHGLDHCRAPDLRH